MTRHNNPEQTLIKHWIGITPEFDWTPINVLLDAFNKQSPVTVTSNMFGRVLTEEGLYKKYTNKITYYSKKGI